MSDTVRLTVGETRMLAVKSGREAAFECPGGFTVFMAFALPPGEDKIALRVEVKATAADPALRLLGSGS